MRSLKQPVSACLLALAVFPGAALAEGESGPVPPAEAPGRMVVPEGFQVSLFAGEPDVVQPIAFTFDDRGRLWVVECLSYPDWIPEGREGHDRVVILEDRDGDGRFDVRKVFLENGRNLSGIELGFGGVWLCGIPYLLFVPDRDGDDRPDGPPEPVLDGFDMNAKHNVVNDLLWGPDGWLYGCHGILTTSRVGRPGAPDAERTPINCGVWRYHPVKKTFEVVAHGTTNPWGIDFDDLGQIFITNCVIAHLWHVIPGAHFQRMFGQDMDPHLFELMGTCADHLHWAGGPWTDSREGKGAHGEAGGGHAHVGAMVYLGDNWPPEYRGRLFTCNLHGNRVNQDILERRGSGYVARHGKDFLLARDPRFRGLSLRCGPDGGVFITDWSDSGECHDYDQVERASGRIYKVVHGKPALTRPALARLPDLALAELQLHPNDWWVRQSRRILEEHAAAGRDLGPTRARLEEILHSHAEPSRRLRALWALHVTGGLGEAKLLRELSQPSDAVRGWAVRLLVEGRNPSAAAVERLAALARGDPSPAVRLELASALGRLPLTARRAVAGPLLAHGEDASDQNLPLMLWYGVEPLLASDPSAADMLERARIPLVRRFAARRLALEAGPGSSGGASAGFERLIEALGRTEDAGFQEDLTLGIQEAVRGRTDLGPPAAWPLALARLERSSSSEVRGRAVILSAAFGGKEALAALRARAVDAGAGRAAREAAVQTLVERADPELPPVLHRLLGDPELRGAAIRGMARFDDAGVPPAVLALYSSLSQAEKADALNTLASRRASARALLEAMEAGRVPPRDLPAFTARQIQRLEDPELLARLKRVWGEVQKPSGEKTQAAARYRAKLTADAIKTADLTRGRAVFERTCASCHTLFGSGRRVGPDLTGSQRTNIDYLLENLLDPNAIVAREYQLLVVRMRDGRLLSGVVKEENEQVLTLLTANEEVAIPRREVRSMEPTQLSLMPEGLLEKLADGELVDLFAYLTSEPAPAAAGGAGH